MLDRMVRRERMCSGCSRRMGKEAEMEQRCTGPPACRVPQCQPTESNRQRQQGLDCSPVELGESASALGLGTRCCLLSPDTLVCRRGCCDDEMYPMFSQEIHFELLPCARHDSGYWESSDEEIRF